MSKRFVAVDRETSYLLPPSVDEWLPQDHLARFIVEIVSELDVWAIESQYVGGGSEAYHPRMMLAMLFYSYASGTFSSRRIETSSYDSLAMRYICANTHPDHDTIATFRKRFLSQIKPLFVQILSLAQQMGLLKLGTVSIDGTKVDANASKHKALSWEHALKLEAQLTAEVSQLLEMADQADQADKQVEFDLPEELARRESRLQVIRQAKATLEERAQIRHQEQTREHQLRIAERDEIQRKRGRKLSGKPPEPPPPAQVKPRDQVNLTDAESRIMPVSGGGFEQSYNAQAIVDVATHLILGTSLTQQANDKHQVDWALEYLQALSKDLGQVETILADNGFFSQANVEAIESQQIIPLIALQRSEHNVPLEQRLAGPPVQQPITSPPGTAVDRMRDRLNSASGKALYAKRKSTVETVFGIIKHVLGFRQFLLRGLVNASGEWDLVSLAWNLKRLHKLRANLA